MTPFSSSDRPTTTQQPAIIALYRLAVRDRADLPWRWFSTPITVTEKHSRIGLWLCELDAENAHARYDLDNIRQVVLELGDLAYLFAFADVQVEDVIDWEAVLERVQRGEVGEPGRQDEDEG